jgi:hypothetical protein
MKSNASELLLAGREHIDPIMFANGFRWEPLGSGQSSGGVFDSGRYVKGDRSLELHFRFSLGLVAYSIASVALSHEDYMRHVAPRGAAQYPGFGDNPLNAFRHLSHDLAHYGQDFLNGPGAEFTAAHAAAQQRAKLSGFQRVGRQ